MSNNVAAITGGGKGIGKAIALALAERNWTIAICYRTSEDDALETVRDIEEKGSTGIAIRSDVSDPNLATQFVDDVEKKFGRIDALINCAGPYHRVNLFDETSDGWNAMFDNNLHPIFYLTKAVAPGMRERQWGRIINFGVVNADRMIAQPYITAYSIAKVGVIGLTKTLAKMLAPDGITVNCISPGFIDSVSAISDSLIQMKNEIPAGYVGSTDDVVHTALYLLSEEAKYVNGSNIQISGAWGV